jgi:DNA (cytosine-5)-methyltransferase 1
MAPRLLDLFCGAGGAAMGYHRAGFEVVGVDIDSQPNYPFKFWRADALTFLEPDALGDKYPGNWDAIHASPPCQAFTAYKRSGNVRESPDLIALTRKLLQKTGLPWVIENVEGAPLRNPICGTGLMRDLQRHRLFETNFPLMGVPCAHGRNAPGRFIGGRSRERGGPRVRVRNTVEIGRWNEPLETQQQAMGIDWMTRDELSEAIPPAYTEHIGHYLMLEVNERRRDGPGEAAA